MELAISIISPCLTVLLGLAVSLTIIGFIKGQEDRRFLINLTMWALALRIFVAIFLYVATFTWSRHYGFFIDDGFGYSFNGRMMADRLSKGLSLEARHIGTSWFGSMIGPYDFVNAFIYLLIGYSPLSMLFLTCVTAVISNIFMYLLVKMLFEKKVAKITAIFCSFWPSIFLWSTQNLKEPPTILLLVLCFWSFVSFLKKRNPLYMLFLPVLVYALEWLRSPMGFIFMTAAVIHGVFILYKRTANKTVFFICLGLAVGTILVVFSDIFRYVRDSIPIILFKLNEYRDFRAYGNLAIMRGYGITSIPNLLFYIPVGLTMVLLAPFPWQFLNLSQALAVPTMLLWYAMLPFLFKGTLLAARNNMKYALSLLVFCVSCLVIFGIAEGNAGTLFRHRDIVYYFCFLFTALGIGYGRKNSKPVHIV